MTFKVLIIFGVAAPDRAARRMTILFLIPLSRASRHISDASDILLSSAVVTLTTFELSAIHKLPSIRKEMDTYLT